MVRINSPADNAFYNKTPLKTPNQDLPSQYVYPNSSNTPNSVPTPSSTTTYYQEWFTLDKRRRELLFYISRATELLRGSYPHQRQKGLDQLIDLMSNQLSPQQGDYETFNLIHKSIHEDTNIVLSVIKYVLKKPAIVDGLESDDDETETKPPSPSNITTLFTRENRLQEIKKALTVLEGCFLLSPASAATFAAINGFKVILSILTDGTMFLNNGKYLNLKHVTKTNTATLEQQMEELTVLAFDTLESSLHNSSANTILFCKDSGPDLIVAMLRNTAYSVPIRAKCVEFLNMLMKWAKNADAELDSTATECKPTETTTTMLEDRMKVYLGPKLTDEVIELFNKEENADKQPLYTQFVTTKLGKIV